MNQEGSVTAAADGHLGIGVPAEQAEPAAATGAPMVYRTPTGWRVGGEDLPDLVCAMVLADLLAEDLPPAGRPAAERMPAGTQTARLEVTVAQLQHALANRVRVEQAIGVLAERHRLAPRKAFELLRNASRSRGRRVQDVAGEVVVNVTNPLLPIADELARPPKPPRSRRSR